MGKNAQRKRFKRNAVRQVRKALRKLETRDAYCCRELAMATKRSQDSIITSFLHSAFTEEVTMGNETRTLIDRTWSRDTLKRVLPEGLEPAGTRYDATWKQVHILCTNGQDVVVPLAELEVADNAPRIILP